MTVDIEKLEEIVLQIRCGEILNDGEAADLLDDAIGEIERLRVALKKIAEVNPDDTSSMCWVVKVANAALVTPNAAGGASVLTELLADHPYYCSGSNYYSNEAGAAWETMTDFLAEFDSADVDMNLVFRWDIHQRDEDNPGRFYAEVFMLHQRKGIFSPHHIKHINEDEAVRFRAFLEKHWAVMRAMWVPLSANA